MDRRVKATQKDKNGKIIALCNSDESWSPLSTRDAVKDIKSARRSYYVQELPQRAYVRVVAGNSLQTTSDKTSSNNLDNLPTV